MPTTIIDGFTYEYNPTPLFTTNGFIGSQTCMWVDYGTEGNYAIVKVPDADRLDPNVKVFLRKQHVLIDDVVETGQGFGWHGNVDPAEDTGWPGLGFGALDLGKKTQFVITMPKASKVTIYFATFVEPQGLAARKKTTTHPLFIGGAKDLWTP